MGALCSSSSKQKYDNSLIYLKSKQCTTYTYIKAFSPLLKINNLPYLIIVGENHLKNPSMLIEPRERDCSTIYGILNHISSLCENPTSKTTVFIEEVTFGKNKEDIEDDEDDDDVFNIEGFENGFGINKQLEILGYVEKKFKSNLIDIVRSDTFQIIRGLFFFNENEVNVGLIRRYFYHDLRLWIQNIGMKNETKSMVERFHKYQLIEKMGIDLSNDYWLDIDHPMRTDKTLKYINRLGHIIIVFFQTYKTIVFNENVIDYILNKFIIMFEDIKNKYVIRKRKRPYYEDVGNLITFVGDALTFYQISQTNDIVLISYGQFHSEHFAKLVEVSGLFSEDYSKEIVM